jgi:RNA polymerase sigma-70 factor, ECF subfamily
VSLSSEPAAQAVPASDELASLMHRYQQGDADAASQLVSRVSPQIFQFFLAQVRDRSLSEDLLQDFWLRIHKARPTYRPGEPVLPWLYAIARRVQIDSYRRRKRIVTNEVQTENIQERATGEPPVTEQASISDLLARLPAAQREAVLLLKVTGLTLEEVARATGTTVGAVKQRAHRAYEALRKQLTKS